MAIPPSIFMGIPNPFFKPKIHSISWTPTGATVQQITIPVDTMSSKVARQVIQTIQDHLTTHHSNPKHNQLPISIRLRLSSPPKEISEKCINILSQIPTLSPRISHLELTLPIPDRATASILAHTTSLTSLHVEGGLQRKGMKALSNTLKKNMLTELALFPSHSVTNQELEALNRGLSQNSSLRTFALNTRTSAIESIRFLSPHLAFTSTLNTLSITSSALQDPDLSPISRSLIFNHRFYNYVLPSLYLSTPLPLPEQSMRSLKIGLLPLRSLSLSRCGLRDSGVRELSLGLRTNPFIETLELDENEIFDQGAATLAEALTVNSSIRDLNLSENKIGAGGGAALAQMLEHNRSLTHLDMTHNTLGQTGCVHLIEALLGNEILKELKLAENGFKYNERTEDLFSSLNTALKTTNTALSLLEIEFPITSETIDALIISMDNNAFRELTFFEHLWKLPLIQEALQNSSEIESLPSTSQE